MRIAILIITLALGGCTALSLPKASTPVPPTTAMDDGVAVKLPRSKQYDFTSRINGRSYRIYVAMPFHADTAKRYPVVYVLDGNAYFATMTEAMTRQSVLRVVAPAIVVGIGYPTDNPMDVFPLRTYDMTPSPATLPELKGKGGGGDAFIQVVQDEIMPLVNSRYPTDSSRQALWGHSLGGLTVLRTLLREPELFSTYILSSPSIWFNDREVLADEASFAQRVRTGNRHVKILVLSAADEQYRGTDPKELADANAERMVDNASELAERLGKLPTEKVTVERIIFTGELHETVSQASLSRALRFALPLKQ